jgi:hypothetical protein
VAWIRQIWIHPASKENTLVADIHDSSSSLKSCKGKRINKDKWISSHEPTMEPALFSSGYSGGYIFFMNVWWVDFFYERLVCWL